MGDVVVRLGRPEDIDAALAVYLLANDTRRGGNPTPASHIERVRQSMGNPDAFLLVAEDSDACTGMGLAMPGRADDGAGPPVPGLCYISMIFVAPVRWGEGIGGRIVDAVLSEARLRGYVRAELWTHADNQRSQRLYEARGFRRSGREKNDDLGDRIILYERATPSSVDEIRVRSVSNLGDVRIE